MFGARSTLRSRRPIEKGSHWRRLSIARPHPKRQDSHKHREVARPVEYISTKLGSVWRPIIASRTLNSLLPPVSQSTKARSWRPGLLALISSTRCRQVCEKGRVTQFRLSAGSCCYYSVITPYTAQICVLYRVSYDVLRVFNQTTIYHSTSKQRQPAPLHWSRSSKPSPCACAYHFFDCSASTFPNMSSDGTEPLINKNPTLQNYYASLESRIGYRLFLGDTRHFGYYRTPSFPLPNQWRTASN